MMFLRPRHLARLRSERVANTDAPETNRSDTSPPDADDNNDEEGSFVNRPDGTSINNSNVNTTTHGPNDDVVIDIETGNSPTVASAATTSRPSAVAAPTENVVESDSEDDDEDDDNAESGVAQRFTIRHTMSLAELEEEREMARRRSSACVLFALFILFRLWILALQEGDFGLLLLCLVGSSWTARWIRYNRDQEEELDRRIANYMSNSENGSNTEIERDDLRMLSFQAQLALAIMESQRQMMQGGYGHPDGNGNQTPGVSESARGKWTKFAYKAARDKKESRRGSYGSVAQDVSKPGFDEEPHCSICLGEYEEGEDLSKLPCSHIYHDECITSWCSNHIRCPLCNYDLESEPTTNEPV